MTSVLHLTEFCIKVHFPHFFEVKAKHLITDGPNNFFSMLKKVTQFPDKQMKDNALKVLRRNACFVRPEHVIIAMLGDENKPVRDFAVDKIMSLRETLATNQTDTFEETSCEEVKSVRKFKVPFINENATSYNQLVDLRLETEPSLLHHLTNDELKNVRQKPMFSKQPCHNQAVVLHVKLVIQAFAAVAGFERRDSLTRQMINSRSLIKKIDCEKQFVLLVSLCDLC